MPKKPENLWPEGVAGILELPCGVCNHRVLFDYTVEDEVWEEIAPPEHHLGVICLPCLDRLAVAKGVDISESLIRVQYTGINKTVILVPRKVHRY